jgi:hypothetical protein
LTKSQKQYRAAFAADLDLSDLIQDRIDPKLFFQENYFTGRRQDA